MSEHDPLDALAVGVAADHQAKKTRKAKAKADAPAPAADEGNVDAAPVETAQTDATTTDATTSDASESSATSGAVETTPPAPGDEREAVFARRLDRLTTLVEEAEFDSGTVFGDTRDLIVDMFKHRPALWPAMDSGEQRDLVRHVEQVVKTIIGRIVLVIAEEDSHTIQATLLGNFNVKGDAIEAKLKIDNADDSVILDVYKMAGHRVVLISADDKRFMATRKGEVKIDPDQLGMAFADAPRDPAAPADDAPEVTDEDLADGDDSPSGVTAAIEASEASGAEFDPVPEPEADDWGVFDTERKEWLIDESGGDDGWTTNSGDAGRWSHDEAKSVAENFDDDGAGIVVTRRLFDDAPPAVPADQQDADPAD